MPPLFRHQTAARLRRYLALSAALVTGLLAACSTPTSPATPATLGRTCPWLPYRLVGLQAITPAPDWEMWYHQAEECTGVEADFSRVYWYLVSEVLETDGSPSAVRGVSCADDIYLTSRDEDLVRHELLHQILQQPGHPDAFFPRCAEGLLGR